MNEKSRVGMSQCFYCGEAKNEIVLTKRLRKSLPHLAVYNVEPCGKCKSHMEQGIILIGARSDGTDTPYRTGHFFVVTEAFIKRVIVPEKLRDQILDCRWSFIDETLAEEISRQQQELEVATID